jgi:hypothetical protein
MKRFAPALLILFLVNGCAIVGAPALETQREKYAAAETTYKTAVTTIDHLATAGKLQKGSAPSQRIAAALRRTRTALNIWGHNPDSLTGQPAALTALTALQAALIEVQRGVTP